MCPLYIINNNGYIILYIIAIDIMGTLCYNTITGKPAYKQFNHRRTYPAQLLKGLIYNERF